MKGVPSLGKKQGKGRPQPTWREMLQLRPVRNPQLEWTEEDGRVVLHVKQYRKKTWKNRLLHLLVPLPNERRVVLDSIGKDVWQLVDGENTLGRIASELADKYKLSPREAELSLQQYFKELSRRGYVAFLTEEKETSQAKQQQRK